MADVVNMEGSVIDVAAPCEDPDIKEHLEYYLELNKKGYIKGIGIAVFNVDLETDVMWVRLGGCPNAPLLGAIELLKDKILQNTRIIMQEKGES